MGMFPETVQQNGLVGALVNHLTESYRWPRENAPRRGNPFSIQTCAEVTSTYQEISSMGHGGKREASGRRKGSLNRKTQAIAKDMIASGALTPLEVMVKAMTIHVNARRWDQAAAIAKDAAPYIHPRLAATQVVLGAKPELLNEMPGKLEISEAIKLVESRFADAYKSQH